MASDLVRRYNAFEDQLVVWFQNHPFWRQLTQMDDNAFVEYLLQLGVLSSHFVRWYEMAKLGLESEPAKEVIRSILRDEIPQGAPTHQDDRLWDLAWIGVPKSRVLSVRPSGRTRRTVKGFYAAIKYPQEMYDLRVMVTLRVAGEVLVAETYRHVVAELDRRSGFQPELQRFYNPHFQHDLKDQEGEGHSDAFDDVLEQLIIDEDYLETAMNVAEQAFRLRFHFHDQFRPLYRIRRVAMRAAALAASLLTLLCLSDTIITSSRLAARERARMEWRMFLHGLPPAARQFYTDCDVWLADHRVKSGDLAALDIIGTKAAVYEVWGDGP